ncbi:hypothetical protein FACS1894218_6880 [Bacilli bacterium]|nr:hypothetical protein FACS1894218_6880 [Bacilli bacterium]
MAGTFAVIGHCYPIQYIIALIKFKGDKAQANKYKGGKGAATTGGVLFSVSP